MQLFAFEHHHERSPWDSAPPWAIELRVMLGLILKTEEDLMSAASDLNNAVSALALGFASLDTAVQTELTALSAALADNNTDAINQAISNISTVTNKMAADAAALTASIPAATTVAAPAPAPDPVVAPTVDVPVIAAPAVTDPAATPPTS